jgi:hypothetical protein
MRSHCWTSKHLKKARSPTNSPAAAIQIPVVCCGAKTYRKYFLQSALHFLRHFFDAFFDSLMMWKLKWLSVCILKHFAEFGSIYCGERLIAYGHPLGNQTFEMLLIPRFLAQY